MKSILLIAVLLFSSFTFAADVTAKTATAPAEEVLSLQQRAEQETNVTDPKALNQAESTPEVQVSSGALTLADPYEPLTTRAFIWTFGFQLQDYQPEGRATLAEKTSYNLNQSGKTVLPSVTLGSLYSLGHSRAGHFQMGLNGQLGYANQNVKTNTSNATSIDARLSTTQIEGKIVLRWALHADSKLHLLAQGGLGQLSVSQTSSNSVARWSESEVYQVSGIGAELNLGKEWLAHLTYNQKSIQDGNANLGIQGNNVELGAKVLW